VSIRHSVGGNHGSPKLGDHGEEASGKFTSVGGSLCAGLHALFAGLEVPGATIGAGTRRAERWSPVTDDRSPMRASVDIYPEQRPNVSGDTQRLFQTCHN